ncbi:hypothetical protein KY333_01110 [Candidatus Woesearchaeota archaeon]|nr:hypothetical protein [Candidatus Woesearchaeota archaeon]
MQNGMRLDFSHGQIKSLGDVHKKDQYPLRKKDYFDIARSWNQAKKENIFGENWPNRKIID